jgi:hypothetical protein
MEANEHKEKAVDRALKGLRRSIHHPSAKQHGGGGSAAESFTRIVYDVIDRVLVWLRSDENRYRIETHIVDPLVKSTLDRIFPYLLIFMGLYLLLFSISVITLFIVIHRLPFPAAAATAAAAAAAAAAATTI